ncbi:hypothetical protein FPV16_25735 [Methylobacterium sp. W2]|uniref:glycoside hydrolase family 108 protein n=1 Tax=Methylobacterium sp. W2 TaxID=2598107 RepID=UPI001D0C328F|nr:glycoside hydrolase family 108 protein [Methylobacterium sp. W2]MCC0809556.1 hypothetical protein [Methylobacterium sp. W2]
MAASNFERALPLVLKHEGGYVDHPSDPGGATNLGVTIGTLSSWLKRPATKADVKALTRATVAPIYRKNYWDVLRCDEMPAGVDYAVFDFGVNSGPKRAAMALQRAIGVADDGIIGKVTIANIATRPVDQIIERLMADRMTFLRRLSTWQTFGKGWTSRCDGVLREALAMAHAAPIPTPPVTVAPIPSPPQGEGSVPASPGPLVQPAPRKSGVLTPAKPLPEPTYDVKPSWGSRLTSWLMRPWFG